MTFGCNPPKMRSHLTLTVYYWIVWRSFFIHHFVCMKFYGCYTVFSSIFVDLCSVKSWLHYITGVCVQNNHSQIARDCPFVTFLCNVLKYVNFEHMGYSRTSLSCITKQQKSQNDWFCSLHILSLATVLFLVRRRNSERFDTMMVFTRVGFLS